MFLHLSYNLEMLVPVLMQRWKGFPGGETGGVRATWARVTAEAEMQTGVQVVHLRGGGAAQHWCEHGPGCCLARFTLTRPTHLAGPCDLHPAGQLRPVLQTIPRVSTASGFLYTCPSSELPLGNQGAPNSG